MSEHTKQARQEFVVGFLFSRCEQRVVLIEKNRPEWQAGLLNGPGGKIEPGETTLEAIRREFREEAGLDIPGWEHFCERRGR
jgi:8-oxo-dGTP diphosphatase